MEPSDYFKRFTIALLLLGLYSTSLNYNPGGRVSVVALPLLAFRFVALPFFGILTLESLIRLKEDFMDNEA